jgi:glycerate kinase
VITGKGAICEQTIYNKAPIVVAKLAKGYDIPVASVNALLGKNYELMFNYGIDAVISSGVNEARIMGMKEMTEIAAQFGNKCFQNGKIIISKKSLLL